ncbi:MAG TPA: acyltransferase [Polyangia bacterium]|nr:acyltransferase [Polyangia bacterium]
MSVVDDLILSIKRGDTPATRLARDTYRALLHFNLPDTPATRRLFASLYYAHDAAQAGREWALSKLLIEPMVRARFHSVGARLRCGKLPYIVGHTKITVGDDCTIGKLSVASGRFVDEPELRIGNHVTIGTGVFMSVNKRVTIGDHVGIAGRVAISDSDGHPGDVERRLRGEPMTADDIQPVTIEDYVWIGRDAHILKGVTIGRGAAVASGSVVATDVPPGALAMGVPARIVKRA